MSTFPQSGNPRSRQFAGGKRSRKGRDRRGLSLIVVLGLVTIALALSFGILWSQANAVRVQENTSHRDLSRQAALTGLSVALRQMHQLDWAGVDSVLSNKVGPTESFSVRFTSGDARLVPGAADYDRLPFRVTLEVTGSSTNRSSPASPSTHRLTAVVELKPKKLAAEPAEWDQIQQYTVFQCTSDDFTLEFPSRVEGPVWVQGTLKISQDYPSDDNARKEYLEDLVTMNEANVADYRILTGPLHWRKDLHPDGTKSLVKNTLGLDEVSESLQSIGGWRSPGQHTTYRLYAGGKLCTAATITASLSNVTLEPDMAANPLGLFVRSGDVSLNGNVTIHGTLIASGDVLVVGKNVTFQPPLLPAIYGTSKPVRLPAIVAGDDFRVGEMAGGSAQGLIAVWDEFEIQKGMEDVAFDVQGRVVTGKFSIGGRTPWDHSSWMWSAYLSMFDTQRKGNNAVTPYFPIFMGFFGRNPKPLLTVRPADGSVTDHWKRPEDPVFVPDPADAGLCWTLLDVRERP